MSRFNPGFMRDLLLLGMMFIADRTQRQDIGLLRALPFIYTYQDLGLVPPYVKERQRLMRDGASIQKVLDDSHVLRLDRKPTSRQLRIEAMTQEKNLLLILPPGDIDIDRMRVLGPSGYLLRITNAGLAYADSIESAYAGINPFSFGEAWMKTRIRLGRMHSRMKKEKSKLSRQSADDSRRRNIPPATAPEATWMWNDE